MQEVLKNALSLPTFLLPLGRLQPSTLRLLVLALFGFALTAGWIYALALAATLVGYQVAFRISNRAGPRRIR
ncbi:MAG: hypothetical protein AAF529_07585 [Pseudomonadota bacterium]